MNVTMRQFQENMVNLVNSAHLPIEAKRLVVCEVLHKIEEQANIQIACEIQEQIKREEAKETEEE